MGDLIYLKLQPYKQHFVRRILNQELAPKYFGPFIMEPEVGQVAYYLQLPSGSHIHSTFHLSQLKRHVGQQSIQPILLVMDLDGTILKELVCILDRCLVK